MRAVAEATDRPERRPARAARPPPKRVPPLREAEARAAAALQRLLIARDTLDAEETRARERLAELDRRLAQFEEDVARERTLVADAEAALAQLAQEEETLAPRSAGQRRTPLRRRCPRGRGRQRRQRRGKDLRRIDRRAGRPHRAPQPAHGDRARAVRARRAHGKRNRQYRGRPRRRLREPARPRGAGRRG